MPSKARITVLVENTVSQGLGLLAEHGLSYWIEWDGRHVLFDTGQGRVLAENAERLGIPLIRLDGIVLSHGHYDHTGGLSAVLRDERPVPVHVHPAAFHAKYGRSKDGAAREIGLPDTVEKLLRRHARHVVATTSPTSILPGLTVTGTVPRTTDFEDTGGPFYLDPGCTTADPLVDDQSLFFGTPEGTVVLLGCAHSGVINTVRYVRELSGDRPIRAVIGGMHLISASPERIARTVEELRPLDLQVLAPAHCTGPRATAALWNAFPAICTTCHVGTTFEFELPAALPSPQANDGQ